MAKPPPDAYRNALVEARGIAARITQERAERIRQAVVAYGRGLQEALAGEDLQGVSEEEALTRSERIVRGQAARLRNRLQSAIAEGRTISFEEILLEWERTAGEVADSMGTDLAALGGLRAADVSLVNAFDAIGAGQNWRTLIQGHVENAAAEANEIIRRGFAEGVTGDELARRLRKYVEGAEDFQDLFSEVRTATGEVAKIDLRTLAPARRKAAAQMRHNARRIAFSEIQNARQEAEIQHFLRDPMVESVKWVLSPNRGLTFSPPDECDVLADADMYGMGPGVFPIASLPPPPHPFCRCENRPITRDLENADDPKPLDVEPQATAEDVEIPNSDRLTETQMDRIRQKVDRSITEGQTMLRDVAPAIRQDTSIRVGSRVSPAEAEAAATDALPRQAEDVAEELEEIAKRGERIREEVEEELQTVASRLEDVNDRLQPMLEKIERRRENLLVASDRVADLNEDLMSLDFRISQVEGRLDRLGPDADDVIRRELEGSLATLRSKREELGEALEEAREQQNVWGTRLKEAKEEYHEARGDDYMELVNRKSHLHRRKLAVQRAERSEMRKVLARPPSRKNTVKLDHQLRKNTEQIDRGLEAFRNMVDRKYLEDMTLKGSPNSSLRAHYSRFDNSINLHPDRRNPATVLHEIAHAIEYEHPAVAEASKEFFEERTEGEELQLLQDLASGHGYRKYEKAKPDDFFRPYVGKVYPGRAATEIVTMGLERMWKDPVGFWQDDPGHFEFTWKVMNGVF